MWSSLSRSSLLVALVALGCVRRIDVPLAARQYSDECLRLFLAHELKQAEIACDRALEYQPDFWDALHNKGVLKLARGDRSAAKALFMKAVRANQEMASSYTNLGVLALEDQQYRTAADYFRRALVVQPELFDARSNLGLAYFRMGDFDRAEEAYRHVVLSHPNEAQPYADLGVVMLEKKKPATAVEWFEKALRIAPNSVVYLKGIATAYLQLGMRDEAKDAIDSCLIASPDDEACQQAMRDLQ